MEQQNKQQQDPAQAFQVVVTACRAYKGDANEHEAIQQSLLTIKALLEATLAPKQEVAEPEAPKA